MIKSALMIIGGVLIGLAAVWYFWLGPSMNPRLSEGWEWKSQAIGTQAWADFETGQYPAEDFVNFYDRTMRVISAAEQPDRVIVEERSTTYEPDTREVTWEAIFSAPVDPKTGQHLQADYAGDYFVLPRNAEKTTYNMRFGSYQGLPFAFQREENIEGVETYVFYYKGHAEYTFTYASTEDYAGVDVEPGQEIKCKDDQLTVTIWVEPVSGEMVKFDEACSSGDSVFDIASGEELYAISRWTGVSAGDDVVERADSIRQRRARILWTTTYGPALLLIVGLVALAVGVMQRGGKAEASTPAEIADDQAQPV